MRSEADHKTDIKSDDKTSNKAHDKKHEETDVETDDEADDEADNGQPNSTYLPDLEDEESAKQRRNQRGQGIKILTPNEVLTRLSIAFALAHLKAGNNSEKLKNEMRQLLYSLHPSKKLTKTIYKHLMILFKNENNLYEHWKW